VLHPIVCAEIVNPACHLWHPGIFFSFFFPSVVGLTCGELLISTMAHPEKYYCRGCKCTTNTHLFNSNGKRYKQCNRCRERIRHRKQNVATIVCECGREVLRTSLRDHVRTLYHEQHVGEKKARTVAPTPAHKAIVPMVSQQPKPVPINYQPKPVPATPAPVTKLVAKAPSSIVFRKKSAIPVTLDSLRAKLKQVQAMPAL